MWIDLDGATNMGESVNLPADWEGFRYVIGKDV
jgi:hypothetical protein